MKPHQLALRLVRLRQHSLAPLPDAKQIRRAYSDELHTYAAWLTQKQQRDTLPVLLNILITEIALNRANEPDWLPVIDLLATELETRETA